MDRIHIPVVVEGEAVEVAAVVQFCIGDLRGMDHLQRDFRITVVEGRLTLGHHQRDGVLNTRFVCRRPAGRSWRIDHQHRDRRLGLAAILQRWGAGGRYFLCRFLVFFRPAFTRTIRWYG